MIELKFELLKTSIGKMFEALDLEYNLDELLVSFSMKSHDEYHYEIVIVSDDVGFIQNMVSVLNFDR